MSQTATESPQTTTTKATINTSTPIINPPENGLNLSTDDSLSLVEKIYDLIRRNEDVDKIAEYLNSIEVKSSVNVNEILKNGDTLICLCCNKKLENLVKILVESYSANVNLCRSLNVNTASFSTVTPTVTITARRQSRLLNSNGSSVVQKNSQPKG